MALLVAATPAAAAEPIALVITPRAVEEPSLRYALLPETREVQPGNAIQAYYRAFSPEWYGTFRHAEMSEKLITAMTHPLTDLRGKAGADVAWVRDAAMLKELDRAARLSHCDWQLEPRIREDGIRTLLPDMQAMRQFSVALSVRARLEIADGRWDAASRTLATEFQLGRHVSDGPTLIQTLVGVACANIAAKQVEAWVSQPGAPNLYWSLTSLPQPLFTLRRGLQGERLMLDQLLPGGRECLRDPKLARRLGKPDPAVLDQWRHDMGGRERGNGIDLPLTTARLQPDARALLASLGWSAEQVAALTPLQAMLLHQLYHFDRQFDRYLRALELPPAERLTQLAAAEMAHGADVAAEPVLLWMPRLLLPATGRAVAATIRADRQVAALRAVELLRHHAATHNGTLPDTLAGIDGLPVPLDPVTGKAVQYERRGDAATVTTSAIPGDVTPSVVYTITVAR